MSTNFCWRPPAPVAGVLTGLWDLVGAARAQSEIASWPEYEPSPVFDLLSTARENGVAAICYKDEGARFGLGSFKALGGAYAVLRIVQARLRERGFAASVDDLRSRKYAQETGKITVTTATDGNHGRSVAWGAQQFGVNATIYIPSPVSNARKRQIEAFGARVERIEGNYDQAVSAARRAGEERGWVVVSDTSYPGYEDVPLLVMQGYTTMVAELQSQLRLDGTPGKLPTHVFVQCGVGALPAAICAQFYALYGDAAPAVIVVEPENAACLLASAQAGRLTPVRGALDTIMAGLACGEPSLIAWNILSRLATAYMTVPDLAAVKALRLLASARTGAPPIVAGETGASGLAGFLVASATPHMRETLKIDADSRILIFGTESDTDPMLYKSIIALSEADLPNLHKILRLSQR